MCSTDIYLDNFYVYVYLDPITREPFYVGKGKGERAKAHLKESNNPSNNLSKHHKIRKIQKTGMSPIIIFPYADLYESEAFHKESSLIAHYGRRDMGTGCLCNMSDGGEGNSGHRYCEDPTRHKLINIYTREVVYKNRMEMREELKLDRASVCCLMKGRKKHSHNWYLGDIPEDFQCNRLSPYDMHTLINCESLEIEKGTIKDLTNSTGLRGKEISYLIRGRKHRIKKWSLLEEEE